MATTEPTTQQANLQAEGLKRDVGLLGLMWASEGSIIGSGWLFGALTAVILAGPSALLCWVIASVIIVLLALVHAELGGIFPVTGGTSRFPHYAYGSLAGASFGWFAYIQAATVAPIEVLATIQYLSVASWASSWYKPATGTQLAGTLSGAGIAAAIVLMVIFVIINLMGIRWLANTNNALTTWKVAIPILTIIVFLFFHFHSSNLTAAGGFFLRTTASPSAAKNILLAIPGAGIVFALLGFEQAVQLGGEGRNPQHDLPRAVIGSIAIGASIYVLVQLAFIGALDPATVAKYGWDGLGHDAALSAAPFYTVAKVAAIGWLAWILRLDAVISPAGTGLIYLTSTSRISYGLSKNGYVPSAFESTTKRSKVPAFGIIISTLIGMLFLLPFPSWASMVSIVTGASVLMYAGAPLALGALRLSKPHLPRTFRLPIAQVLAPLAFILASEVVYWAGWYTVGTLALVIIIGYLLMILSRVLNLNPNQPKVDFKHGWWVLVYLVGMVLISYFGQYASPFTVSYGSMLGGVGWFKTHLLGGTGAIPIWWDLLVVAGFSLAIYIIAVYFSRLPEEKVDEYVRDVFPPPTA